MILWINGAFGSGKTTVAFELNRRIKNSFVYDPENIGYFIRRNTPFGSGDFQDFELWREFNYKMLKFISDGYDGLIIAPMTITSPLYFDEIIGRLQNDGVDVRHFILMADRETLLNRLRFRELRSRLNMKENWAVKQIDRCINAFEKDIDGIKIDTVNKSIDSVVNEIGRTAGVSLLRDKRTGVGKALHRAATLMRHIR